MGGTADAASARRGREGRCAHSVQFYADDGFLLDGLASFVGQALGAGDASGSAHRSAIGLGLHVAREIVGLHGGSIRVEQPVGPGTRLVMTLPPATGSPD